MGSAVKGPNGRAVPSSHIEESTAVSPTDPIRATSLSGYAPDSRRAHGGTFVFLRIDSFPDP
jgi:hypothetical protein